MRRKYTKYFPMEFLNEILETDKDNRFVEDNCIGKSIDDDYIYELIFIFDNKYYKAKYAFNVLLSQRYWYHSYSWDSNEKAKRYDNRIECKEVDKVPVTIYEWVEKEKGFTEGDLLA